MAERREVSSGIIVMAAPNGGRRTKDDHPGIPITPAEIGEEAARCKEAGAAIIHVHVRDRNNRHVLDPELYRHTIGQIERTAGYNLIVQITTEAAGHYSPQEQIAVIKAVRPEAVSIGVNEIVPAPEAEPAFAELMAWMQRESVWPQFLLYRPEELRRFQELKARGVIPFRRPFVLFVLGKYTRGQNASPEELDPFLDALTDEDIVWSFCSFGKSVFDCADRVMRKGGHVRVGLENNFHMPDGSEAPSNAGLVRAMVESARKAGRKPLGAAGLRQLKTEVLM